MTISRQNILESISQGIVATDTQGTVVFINDVARLLMHLTGSQQTGSHIASLSTYLAERLAECRNRKRGMRLMDFQLDGNRMEGEISTIMQQGGIAGFVCSLRERHVVTTGGRLSTSEMLQLQLDAVFNFSELGIWILDGEGTVLKLNRAAEKLIEIKAEEIQGKNIERLAEKGVIDQALTPHILKSKRPVTKLLHVLKTDRYVMSTGMPVMDEDGNILLVVVQELDITTLRNLQGQLDELRVLAEKYQDELSHLNLLDIKTHGIVSESKEMKQVLNAALKLARFDVSNILIQGESGTGKGLIAQFIHKSGKRKDKPFIQINCAALPETLLEAELFGFDKGSFTGAGTKGKIGLFEMAQHGTILLDEIGELPLSLQSKLLKCLDDHEIMHIGGLNPIKIDCTIIAATNRDLKAGVAEKKFREDLYHRLNIFGIELPPLRRRPEDIVALAHFFLERYNRKYDMQKRLSLKALHRLQRYAFPGNVRELKNCLKQAVVMHDEAVLDDILPDGGGSQGEFPWPSIEDDAGLDLAELLDNFEKSILNHTMAHCASTRQAAAYLNTSQSKIARLMKKHGISTGRRTP
ncbi:MAG: sigma 54-interacting transcriptional regulator [Deltaproteobacteria bacterium]|nr:sigma 54-interacting transcriptional regulator [Deltaproteobacteria bacterium]